MDDKGIVITIAAEKTPTADQMEGLRSAVSNGATLALLIDHDTAPSLEDIPSAIALGDAPAAIAISDGLMAKLPESAQGSDLRLAGAALAVAITEGASISCIASSGLSATPAARSEILKGAISQVNIEEMFPNHQWATHQDESVAACFHTLAALFIRIGDFEAAEECLASSEQYEDSPRSLALKAFISRAHGETLGAVANFVSSLQQYEQRKQDDSSHYFVFKPSDMETINFRLKEGLEALNKRENETALEKFAEAVFHFDSFYGEMGLDKSN